MGITDEEQKPLVDQAIHGGATSKYNDIQWLHGQRDWRRAAWRAKRSSA